MIKKKTMNKVQVSTKSVKRPPTVKCQNLVKKLKTKDVVLNLIANRYNIDKTARDLKVDWQTVRDITRTPEAKQIMDDIYETDTQYFKNIKRRLLDFLFDELEKHKKLMNKAEASKQIMMIAGLSPEVQVVMQQNTHNQQTNILTQPLNPEELKLHKEIEDAQGTSTS